MRKCKRCKDNEAEIGSLNCSECNERNERYNAKMIAKSKPKKLKIPVDRYVIPSDILDLLAYIATSDERLYREKARALLRRYCS